MNCLQLGSGECSIRGNSVNHHTLDISNAFLKTVSLQFYQFVIQWFFGCFWIEHHLIYGKSENYSSLPPRHTEEYKQQCFYRILCANNGLIWSMGCIFIYLDLTCWNTFRSPIFCRCVSYITVCIFSFSKFIFLSDFSCFIYVSSDRLSCSMCFICIMLVLLLAFKYFARKDLTLSFNKTSYFRNNYLVNVNWKLRKGRKGFKKKELSKINCNLLKRKIPMIAEWIKTKAFLWKYHFLFDSSLEMYLFLNYYWWRLPV